VLLLYALLHGCARFHEYCLVRSDLDTLLLPLLELLYSAHERTSNQASPLKCVLAVTQGTPRTALCCLSRLFPTQVACSL
jgi:hypothetical protein